MPLDVTLSQLAFDVAVQGQVEALIVNATELEPPEEVAFALELPRDAVHPEACEIAKVEPPAMIEPERAGPLLAATVNATLLVPVPEAVTPVTKPLGDDAVQVQAGALIVIVKDEVVPAAATDNELGDKLAVQPLAWFTVKVWPAIVNVPERARPTFAWKS